MYGSDGDGGTMCIDYNAIDIRLRTVQWTRLGNH
jgi:hypothetical protein